MNCVQASCIDEWLGVIAILIGILGYAFQFIKTASTLDVSSFSTPTLVLFALSEMLFAVQGYMKGSYTILATRSITTIACIVFIVILLVGHSHNDNKKKKEC